jgi:feruloyl-CoA synthase
MPHAPASAPPPPFRPVRLGAARAGFETRPDGAIRAWNLAPLPPFPRRLTEHLVHWAGIAPDRTFLAERAPGGAWRRVSYAEALSAVRALAQGLLARDLGPERPLAILSGNSIAHALLALACLHVGIPYAPVSTAYSLVATDLSRLHDILERLTPGLVVAAEPGFERAQAAIPPGTETRLGPDALAALQAPPTAAVERAFAAVTPDKVGKILFTSGSTGRPKGVINTQRMLCANQEMIRAAFAVLADEPPILLDWLPWSHTFGGNQNFGLALYNGGTLHIDHGRPTSAGIGETLRNLRDVSPTIYFNVPKGFEELAHAMRADPALARSFFARLRMMFYAGAGLAQPVWDEIERLAVAATGERIVMVSGLGATETASFALFNRPDVVGSGRVGLPLPGNEILLVPHGEKRELRVRGPNVTPGYWRDPDATAAAFDAEGFYRMGDALAFVDDADWQKGFRFDGRLGEDFKLASGTWVSVGPLRAALVAALAPLVRDAVIAGENRDHPAALLIPDEAACAGLARAELRARLAAGLRAHAAGQPASRRVARALLLDTPLSIDAGEITDKGSVNQRAVLARRAALVEDLYAAPAPAGVIDI